MQPGIIELIFKHSIVNLLYTTALKVEEYS